MSRQDAALLPRYARRDSAAAHPLVCRNRPARADRVESRITRLGISASTSDTAPPGHDSATGSLVASARHCGLRLREIVRKCDRIVARDRTTVTWLCAACAIANPNQGNDDLVRGRTLRARWSSGLRARGQRGCSDNHQEERQCLLSLRKKSRLRRVGT